MAILAPSYCEDQLYAAYRDRLLIKSLGIQAGVSGKEDYIVSAGTGLQVNVKAGNAFVEQTKAIEESENSFYNGMYQVPNPTITNPYNSVEVSAANPQIAQIILRVYDVGELKIGGNSYGRIEWWNGSANAGATKAHVEEEKAFEYGAAVLPTSSYRLAYVIVPKNATLSSEYSIIDSRGYSSKNSLLYNSVGGTFRVRNGELAVVTSLEGILSLPAPEKNILLGSYNKTSSKTGNVSLTCSSGKISGEYINEVTTINLSYNNYVILQGTGSEYLIISGEPKREQTYTNKSYTKAEAETGVEASSTQPAFVNLVVVGESGQNAFAEIKVGSNLAGETSGAAISARQTRIPCPVWLHPGQKWSLASGSLFITGVEAFTTLQ